MFLVVVVFLLLKFEAEVNDARALPKIAQMSHFGTNVGFHLVFVD